MANNDGLYVRLPAPLKEAVKERYPHGEMSRAIRNLLETAVAIGRDDLSKVQSRLAVVLPECLALQKREAELLAEKKRQENEISTKEKLVEEAHQKLLAELMQAHNRVEDVSRPIIKFWSDKCGESVVTLKAWLKEQALMREKE